MGSPFSTGDFEYRRERMRKRMEEGADPLRDVGGNCLATVVRDASHEMIAIEQGFVMPEGDTKDKGLHERIKSGELDSHDAVRLTYEEMDRLVEWWKEKRRPKTIKGVIGSPVPANHY